MFRAAFELIADGRGDEIEVFERHGLDAVEFQGVVEIGLADVKILVKEGSSTSANTPRFCVLSPLGR